MGMCVCVGWYVSASLKVGVFGWVCVGMWVRVSVCVSVGGYVSASLKVCVCVRVSLKVCEMNTRPGRAQLRVP